MSWADYLPAITAIAGIAAVAIGGFFLARWATRRLRERGAQPHLVRATRIAITASAGVLIVLILYFAFGAPPEVSGLTVSALLVLAITVALQTTIANLIAGVILFQNRVLRLHDTIQIGLVRGRVVQLGLVSTWVRLEDGSVASISNSTLLNGPLINSSAAERLKGEY